MNDWIDCDLPWRTFQTSVRVGMLVELENGDQMLIGSVNELGGCCDCCEEIRGGDIIVRYKQVWSPS